DGFTVTTKEDHAGTGTGFDLTTVEQTTVDGTTKASTDLTVESNADGSHRGTTQIVTSSDGLTITTGKDLTGDDVFDVVTTDVTVVNATAVNPTDILTTRTVADRNADGSLRSQTATTTSL